MNFSISNIAWPLEQEAAVADLMRQQNITGVEVAPTKMWPQPLNASDAEIQQYRGFWVDRGIQIVAMQSLLYGRPDLTLFESAEKRRETLDYLRAIMRMGGRLGAKALVFGSPKNRQVGDLPPTVADEVACDFFAAAGAAAVECDVVLCIEANPVQYQCDFITTTAEAQSLVQRVGHPGFALHLDTGGITLNGESAHDTLNQCRHEIFHFHASEPFLGALGQGDTNHAEFSEGLNKLAYKNWVSVEMRHNPDVETLSELRRVFDFLHQVYGESRA